MNYTSIFLAEVSDKMPSLGFMMVFHSGLALSGFLAIRASRWLAVLAIPISGWYVYALVNEILQDRYFWRAVQDELGLHYIVFTVLAGCLPILGVILGLTSYFIGLLHTNAVKSRL